MSDCSSQRIKLVQGDNLPYINLTLTNTVDGTPIDVSGATVVIFFKATGSNTILSVIPTTYPNGGTDGVVQFNFPGTTLDVPPGSYEGEIEISFGSLKQTVYDLLKFTVRSQFD